MAPEDLASALIAADLARRAQARLLEPEPELALPVTTSVEHDGILATLTLEHVQEDVPL